MRRNPFCNFLGGAGLSICGLILAATFATQVMRAQTSSPPYLQAQAPQGQYAPGQYPPGRPEPIASQCQNALADRVSADAKRRVNLNLETQSPYSLSHGRRGLRGRLRYGVGGPNSWRTATYDCVVDPGRNRVERATYAPRASGANWPGGPGYPGGPGHPGVPNYPRVRVDTSGRGTFNSRNAGNVKITRGFVDSTGARPSVSLRGGNFMITFYGVVENSDGGGFTMRITGSDRGSARGTAQARLNNDRNEVESITVSGNMGRNSFTGNFSR
ncbi:MAG: hypothetical protein WBQ64_06395 [Terriglobales bacterium]|jgi:hypothetical protein